MIDEIDREATELFTDNVQTQSANQAKPQLQKSARHRLATLPPSRSRSQLNDVNDNEQAADDDECEADLDDWISPKFKQAKEEAEAKNRIQSLLSKADTHKVINMHAFYELHSSILNHYSNQ
jgi:murein endopeptidase